MVVGEQAMKRTWSQTRLRVRQPRLSAVNVTWDDGKHVAVKKN